MSERIEFSPIELDALQESMNIGFGKAAAALSDAVDLQVILSVPKISVTDRESLAETILSELRDPRGFALVEQNFRGQVSGTGFLLVTESEASKLAGLYGGPGNRSSAIDSVSLERDVLFEVGNLLIGACVGKIAELLGESVSCAPPRVIGAPLSRALLVSRLEKPGGAGLVFKTLFHFDDMNMDGLLFLVTSEAAAAWIKAAIDRTIEGLL